MANVLTVKVNGVRVSEREKLVRYGVTLSGSYATHTRGTAIGEILNLNAAANPSFAAEALWGTKGPDAVYVVNVGNTGFSMSIVPGVDGLHWQLVIFSGVATEQAPATYASLNLTTDLDIIIEASGRSFD